MTLAERTAPARATGSAGASMEREIREQPALWSAVVRDLGAIDEAARLIRARDVRDVVLVGRGTSDNAARYAQYLLPLRAGVPAHLATPGLVTVYGASAHPRTSAVVAISQSGRSPDLVATVADARANGAPTIAVTNDPDSPLARQADVCVPIRVGPELAVAATKSYTGSLLALYLLTHRLAGADTAALRDCVEAMAPLGEAALEAAWPTARRLAASLPEADRGVVVGRGLSLSTATEAALKLTETCAMSVSGWSAADVMHGPLAQVAGGTVAIALRGQLGGRPSVDAVVATLLERGVNVWGTTPSAQPVGDDLWLPEGLDEELVPLVEILPLQVLALEMARVRGLDPDRPAGLSKVTMTA